MMSDPHTPQEAETDLPVDLIRRVEVMHDRIGRLDYYGLLGLPRTAVRAQVRQAFLAQAPQFHPDKYFGRRLGSYGAKMDRIFAHLSAAHDTLVDDGRRTQYTRALPPEPPLPPTLEQEVAARVASERPAMHAAAKASGVTGEISAAAARARQQALAMQLAGQKRNLTPSPGAVAAQLPAQGTPARPFEALRRPPSSPGMPAADPKAAVEALRRRYEESKANARGRQGPALVQAAEAAAAKLDFVEAARLYRAATEHSSDPNLRAVLADTEAKAKMQSHGEATKRAKESEEKQEAQEAGAQWARAFDLVPVAETAHRASVNFRRAGTDLRRAAKYGEEAVKLAPNKAAFRINLALVYVDLGLGLRAHGEIERAHALEPNNPQLKDAMARVKAMK
jgi:tetratricopeptide (TPR) repeat protein